MPFTTIPADTWTAVVTTTVSTVIQNRGPNKIFLTTEATGALALDAGTCLEPQEALSFGAGVSVSASCRNGVSRTYHMPLATT